MTVANEISKVCALQVQMVLHTCLCSPSASICSHSLIQVLFLCWTLAARQGTVLDLQPPFHQPL